MLVNDRGMSYIEVLIAAAILSVVLIPIISSFHAAAVNYKKSLVHYEASLLAKNLLIETENAIVNSDELDFLFGEGAADLEGFINNENFFSEYKLDKFDFAIRVDELWGTIALNSFTLGTMQNPSDSFAGLLDVAGSASAFSGAALASSANQIISYNGEFGNDFGAFADYSDNTCTINIPASFGSVFSADFYLDATSIPNVVLINKSTQNVVLNIYYNKNRLPNETIDLTCFSNTGKVITNYKKIASNKTYSVSVGVFDKEEPIMYNQLGKVIFVE